MDQAGNAAQPLSRLRHILVVEDDAVLALAIEATLTDAGAAHVELCHTTETALAALRRTQPDAIVLDVHLADRDDGWAIAELVDSLGARRPRIIFSTGDPDRIPPEIAELGQVLTKPYEPADLLRAVAAPRARGLLSRFRRAAR